MRDIASRWLFGASVVAIATGGIHNIAHAQTAVAPPKRGAELRVEQGRDPSQPTGALNASQVAEQGVSDQDIVVTGVRESLRSAQALKRNANQIIDSVQAQDIGKLPDANTTEALQRITGVQIQRRYGEGATDFDHRTSPAITVRGLTQVQNFLDGRAVYSASGGRAFDLEDSARIARRHRRLQERPCQCHRGRRRRGGESAHPPALRPARPDDQRHAARQLL
ncbi:hypothetical protein GCM10020258_39420 [Sphingomonas yabuuchiae]